MKRTGSIASWVGPLVTSARMPCKGRSRRLQQGLDRGDDLVRLRHATEAGLAAGHVAGVRADHADAVTRQRRDVAPGCGMRPHLRIHRRRDQHGLVRGEQRRRRQVICETMRHLGDQIGGRRRDHDQIRLARQADVAHLGLVGQGEQIAEHPFAGQARDRERGDEPGARRRQDAADANTPIAQPADQLEALVGRDAAGNDQQNTLAVHRFQRSTNRPQRLSLGNGVTMSRGKTIHSTSGWCLGSPAAIWRGRRVVFGLLARLVPASKTAHRRRHRC